MHNKFLNGCAVDYAEDYLLCNIEDQSFPKLMYIYTLVNISDKIEI